MTDGERIAVLETKQATMEDDIAEIKAMLKQLVAAANMGKGAWWMLLKVGGLIIVFIGFFGWILDHIKL